ncbi:uncharacterized protein I206_104660 [Kwoniella pini CBS 10737]|uniref:Sulfhydryl oxidase n=1 Tax=Kwoniella pini CBS 10737 TaxID=1296096 RepID=A0A1B9I7J2_9TREE|nr:uncharacterized protein I206_02198 [Kwoniella pini CBS 10737]OCF51484.1 hypothetical protein I206_02198 [Kwoniella pini CBS 10737]
MNLPTSFPSSSSSADPEVSSKPLKTTKETHPNLPPGLILDENGKVCKVCNSWADISKIKKRVGATKDTSENQNKKSLVGMGGFATMMNNSNTNTNQGNKIINEEGKEKKEDRLNCPPDNIILGRSTWNFLHTTAAYYPLKANENQKIQMKNLLESLSIFYPCNWCSLDFQKDFKKNPPQVEGRENLMKWLCERHNEVNKKLGKNEFNCEIKNLDNRWKDGPEDGSCD